MTIVRVQVDAAGVTGVLMLTNKGKILGLGSNAKNAKLDAAKQYKLRRN